MVKKTGVEPIQFTIEKKYLDILKNPNLFNEITITEFDKKIVGELNARRLIFLCSCGNLVENSQIASYNLLINDEAGTGKDYVTKNALSIWSDKILIYKTRISPTVLTYWHNSKIEPDWTWNGKILYLEDISEGVLNSDVFKVMCSSGSEATIVIEQKAVDIKINGKPVIITTTASAIPNPELIRRFAITNLTESKEQTKEIMYRHSEYAMKGLIPEYNIDITTSLNLLKKSSVQIPYATKIVQHFPKNHAIIRTLYPRFLDFIKASTVLHQYQRKLNQENFLIATEQDYEIARECIETIKSNKYMIPLTINQKKILEVLYENKDNPEITQIKGSLTKLHCIFNFMSLPALQTNLGILAKYGIIETYNTTDTWNRETLGYCLNKNYIENIEAVLPKFNKL
jgi:hypothetical protein